MEKKKLKEKRIKQIIDAAVKEFVEKGYHRASLRSIAERAGMSKGGIYHHFNSKDEILIEANNRFYMECVLKFMEEAMANKSPIQGLKGFIRNYLTYWSNHPREMVFIFLSLAKFLETKEMWPEIEEYSKNMISFYEGLFLRGIECGELKEHDSNGYAKILFSAMDGIIGYIVMSDLIDIEETIQQFLGLFISDIEK